MASNRPPRIIRPAQKLNKDNIGQLQVSAHRNFVQAAKIDPKQQSSPTSPSTSEPPNTEPPSPGSIGPESEPVHGNVRKRRALSDVDDSVGSNRDSDDNSDGSQSQGTEPQLQRKKSKKKPKKKKKTSQSMSPCYSSILVRPLIIHFFIMINLNLDDNVDKDGMHKDVQIQSISDESDDDQETRTLNKTRPTADTEEFFQPVRHSDKPVKGDKKKRVKCIPCAYVLLFF